MSNYKTVSELLRECAEADFPLTAIEKKLGCSGVTLGETVNLIADEIDAEKREITERHARQSWMNPADAIAKLATGEIEYPELKNAIDRYYLPRPLFEDGEPVQDSDLEEIGSLATCCVYTDGSWRFDPDKFEDEENPKHCDKQQGRQCDRIKRPKSQVREPDSQERINEDAMKGEYEYWGCNGVECTRCPALVDGKKPKERYGVLWCSEAKTLDLLRRQRELDGRDA